jgi:hypothetical protein
LGTVFPLQLANAPSNGGAAGLANLQGLHFRKL